MSDDDLAVFLVVGLLAGTLGVGIVVWNIIQTEVFQQVWSVFISLLPGLLAGFFSWCIGFFAGRRSSNRGHIIEEARLMIFEKNATQMGGAELWQVVKDKGESSRDGVIAMNELKRRNNPFAEAEPARLEVDFQNAGDEQATQSNHWWRRNS
jgi:hypothetical protein